MSGECACCAGCFRSGPRAGLPQPWRAGFSFRSRSAGSGSSRWVERLQWQSLPCLPGAAGGRGWNGAVGSALCAAVAGAALVVVQRPPPAHTHPRGAAIGVCEFPIESTASRFSGAIRLDLRATVYPADGTITVRLGSLSLTIQPLLTFEAGSKDGYWSILAPSGDRAGPEPRLRRSVRDDEQSCALAFDFLGHGPAALRARADAGTGAITIDATTCLEKLVYSHLNSYCDIEVRGQRRLALEFSPCPGVPVEVRRYDYPVGRPRVSPLWTKTEPFESSRRPRAKKGHSARSPAAHWPRIKA